MRMNNANVEFVAFDAQDVITTSSLAGINLYAAGNIARKYNFANGGVDLTNSSGSEGLNEYPAKFAFIWSPNTALKGNKLYSFKRVAIADIDTFKGDKYTTAAGAAREATSTDMIYNWLRENGFATTDVQ